MTYVLYNQCCWRQSVNVIQLLTTSQIRNAITYTLTFVQQEILKSLEARVNNERSELCKVLQSTADFGKASLFIENNSYTWQVLYGNKKLF